MTDKPTSSTPTGKSKNGVDKIYKSSYTPPPNKLPPPPPMK